MAPVLSKFIQTGVAGTSFAVPVGTNKDDDIEVEREAVPPGHNVRGFRDWEQAQILEAWEAEDLNEVDILCHEALASPTLPRMHRTQYNVFLSFCPGNNADYFLDQALEVVEEMEHLTRTEQEVDKHVVEAVAFWRKKIEELKTKVIDNPKLSEPAVATSSKKRKDPPSSTFETRSATRRREAEGKPSETPVDCSVSTPVKKKSSTPSWLPSAKPSSPSLSNDDDDEYDEGNVGDEDDYDEGNDRDGDDDVEGMSVLGNGM